MKRIYFDSVTKDSAIVAINDTDEYLTAIYLFDETELNRYIRENEEQKLVAGLIYIDNYEEALDSIEDVKRSLLIALVDRKVNKYFTETMPWCVRSRKINICCIQIQVFRAALSR